MVRALGYFILGLALSACSSSTIVDVRRQDHPIIGGKIDTGDPAVVLMYAVSSLENNDWICSATIIAPHSVLTAAHCLVPDSSIDQPTFFVAITNDISNVADDDWYEAKRVYVDPAYDTDDIAAGHDIGILVTNEPLPAAPIPINRTPLQISQIGHPVRFIGFGLTEVPDSDGIKRQVTMPLLDHNSLFVYAGDDTHNTCQGDSGGPGLMVIDGVESVICLTSYGDASCLGSGEYTRVDSYLSFIDPIVAANESPPPDMAPPVPDMTSSGPRAVGAPCERAADCSSLICYQDAAQRYCSAACDPHELYTCPTQMNCQATTEGNRCVQAAAAGCIMNGHQTATPWGLLLGVSVLVWGLKRRRANGPI